MKSGQLKKYNVRNIFLQKKANKARALALDLILFLENPLLNVKASNRHFSFNIFW